MSEIDCRGLACPAPVLKAKEAVEKDGLTEITIIIDNEAAKQNVSRFLGMKGFTVSVSEKEGIFYVSGETGSMSEKGDEAVSRPHGSGQKIMVMVTSDKIGHGDDGLGTKLMASFLKTLEEMGNDLWRLVFVNDGVKLTIDGSPVLEDLIALEKDGINILACGTCLTHFNLMDKKRVGETTNMLDIVTAMQLADKVISL
ncbi:sulfurtransferase-like selenium metabolism protein YedF [Thermodesulfobacteriota bacterium]